MVATNETAELALVGTREGQTVIVTHHFRMIAIAADKPLQELIDGWQAGCQAAWLAIPNNSYTLTKIRARHVCGSLPLDATVEELVGSTGTNGDTTLLTPPWFAGIIRERTASAGRSYRGRIYIPVTSEAQFDKDTLSATLITNMQTYATAMQNTFVGAGATNADWALVVHSKKLASVPGTQCQQSSTLVTSLAVQSVLTTQRSRRARPT